METKRQRKNAPEIVAVPEPKIETVVLTKFRKIGGGSLPLKDKIVKPNEIFYYDKKLIPAAFLDLLEVIEEKEVPVVPAAPVKPKPAFTMQEVPNEANPDVLLYNVVNPTGKVINETPLNVEEAIELKNALEA